MLKLRIITAMVLLALFMCALFLLPTMAWNVLVVAIVLQSSVEWAKLSKLTATPATLYWLATLLIMGGLVWFSADQPQLALHLVVYAISALLWLFIVPSWLIAGWKVEHPVLMVMTGFAVLIPTGLAMMDLRAMSPWLLLFVMGLVWIADSAAYFTGRQFGKRKLAPNISPGKTWEGVAGAVLGVSCYVTLVWAYAPDFAQHVFFPSLLLASWWWVGLAVIGDLFESAIKRQAGVKDSGALLPGHGGLLDRIDALTSTLPLSALVISLQLLH